ncbi:MAG: flavodoxin-dependent (E)-4-hydroxy-3-methylbut-2-enyl-diphosphate synthase [Clostridia bacterium]|nr:flavodoxin-dependent (E)-4-hydroxy-3-methylbut-2-enyl-diphosphate synthase [Clostridia bacterium]
MSSKRQVKAGDKLIGGGARITVQSMTNTETWDVDATVAQIKSLESAGCDIVRSSVYDKECAKAISKIKQNISIPLVADVHFDYRLAIAAIENGADKIRFNPGNIGSEAKVRELVSCAKMHSAPVRIGVNSGSVEKEMLEKYGGPTPEAMVESVLKHVRILERAQYEDMVLSVKASNVPDTVKAYRLLDKQVDYPLHIGVTEAGSDSEGLVKSSMGIGALLLDGIGDTLRVSLTGDVVQEVVAAKMILRAAGILKTGVEVVSCPTCGRCKVDLTSVVNRAKNELVCDDKYIKVAIMGCVVNGPGEAKEADIGIAFAPDGAVMFKKGERVFSGKKDEVIKEFFQQAKLLINTEEQ